MALQELLKNAKLARESIEFASTEQKNSLLTAISEALRENSDYILQQNKIDTENAKGSISEVMIDRLRLTAERVNDMADGIMNLVKLPDPVGVTEASFKAEAGFTVNKIRVPYGVIAIIYESRPNVTADAAAICLKSGNVCVLRGGKEAVNSNKAIAEVMRGAAQKQGFDKNIISFVDDTSRQSAQELMTAKGYVDVLIPRGGAGLIRACVENATVPCIETGSGICHVYVDKAADLDMAVNILYNAKTSRPSVCNACEVCLVHKDKAEEFLPLMQKKLGEKNVRFKLCEKAAKIISGEKAGDNDFDTEFLDYVLAVKVVDSLDEAIKHINAHSTGHSECIVTADSAAASRFKQQIDSAVVYHNVSTRFTDGGVFGFGCEIGISTQKVGVRGPMGLYEMTSYKYVVEGDGQVR